MYRFLLQFQGNYPNNSSQYGLCYCSPLLTVSLCKYTHGWLQNNSVYRTGNITDREGGKYNDYILFGIITLTSNQCRLQIKEIGSIETLQYMCQMRAMYYENLLCSSTLNMRYRLCEKETAVYMTECLYWN